MDSMDLLAVQGTLESLLQLHSSKASIFWHSAFFISQLSHPYMTTEKKLNVQVLTITHLLDVRNLNLNLKSLPDTDLCTPSHEL